MSREATIKELRKKLERAEKLMAQAAEQLTVTTRNLDLLQTRIDYYRNLFVGSAFAAGLGNERPLTEVYAEAMPHMLRLQE